jgi:hypothetical protein
MIIPHPLEIGIGLADATGERSRYILVRGAKSREELPLGMVERLSPISSLEPG